MEFISEQITTSLYNKISPDMKIHNNKIYYVWSEADDNKNYQIWLGSMNIDGSNFIITQLTNELNSIYNPKLYIYNNLIYITWNGAGETSKYQIWITSVELDGSDFKILYITNTEFGAINPKIAIKNDKIYLVYQQRFLDYNYYHMYRARLNLDGSGFESYYVANQNSINETVKMVNIFVDENSNDNIVYYMWERHYPIDSKPIVKIYYTDFDTGFNIMNCIPIIQFGKATPKNFFVKDNKIYFTWVPYTNPKGMCSVVNIDGTGYEDILISDEQRYSLLQVTTNTDGEDIIDFGFFNKIDGSYYPYRKYQLLSAYININTLEYYETKLISEITMGFNEIPKIQFIKTNNEIYYVWYQYNELKYLFSWDNIPGTDEELLISFIKNKYIDYNVNWVDYAIIEKSEDNTVITIYDENNSIILKSLNNYTSLQVFINDVYIENLIIKLEDNIINVYDKLYYQIFTGKLEEEIIDPCEGIVCENICIEQDLYSQKCINGICEIDTLIEQNSLSCGYIPPDPCENVVCENICIEQDLYSQKCINGICEIDTLIEQNSLSCGYIPSKTKDNTLLIIGGLSLLWLLLERTRD